MAWSCNSLFLQHRPHGRPRGARPGPRPSVSAKRRASTFPPNPQGSCPTGGWKKRVRREGWFDGDTLNTAIRQVRVVHAAPGRGVPCRGRQRGTRLEAAPGPRSPRAGGTLLWRGKSEGSPSGGFENRDLGHRPSGHGATQSARAGHCGVSSGFVEGAKTGTAQTPREDHAWFAAYAGPKGQPAEIAVVVFVENGGHGFRGGRPHRQAHHRHGYPRPERLTWSRSSPRFFRVQQALQRAPRCRGSIGTFWRR